LPYHVGDVIKSRGALLLQTPEDMKAKFNVDVRVNNEAVAIDKERKLVTVKQVITGEAYEESYDILVLATGSSPLKPRIPGIDGPGIYSLWTVPDTDKIKQFIKKQKPKRAAVIGGGFIGLEMAENLHEIGCQVSLIEMQDQVMAPLDYEMAHLIHENMRMNNVNLILKDGVKSFDHKGGVTTIHLQSGNSVDTELVILSIGVRPNSQLAKDAGLDLNERGGILVNEHLKTSDPAIYAVGDVIEVEDFVSKGRTMIPLAGPANKQGRICADNIAIELGLLPGKLKEYNGTQGTSIAQIFDLTAASTGVNEKTLEKWGMEPEKDYFVAQIVQRSHAGYYPGSVFMHLKLLFNKEGKIFGAQIVGSDGVDKRIDTIATTMRLNGTVHDLTELELAYAPPYSSAKDPVNMLGYTAENILEGLVTFARWNEIEELEEKNDQNYIVLDVTEDVERMVYHIPGSYHIPLAQLRDRIHELDKNKLIIVNCAMGVRSYNASRILKNSGFNNVKVYPGGSIFYQTLHSHQTER
jgi:NADPH-dependent 2,4-dienoyl-CoA reductase/sulfur reductase-like enzyme/rhodanese-related sulfurtransferase